MVTMYMRDYSPKAVGVQSTRRVEVPPSTPTPTSLHKHTAPLPHNALLQIHTAPSSQNIYTLDRALAVDWDVLSVPQLKYQCAACN